MKSIRLLALIGTCVATLSGCALLKGGKKPVKLELRYAESAAVSYGSSFDLGCYLVYDTKKEKEIGGKDELTLTVKGGYYRNGRITVDNYPQQLSTNTISVKAIYQKDAITLRDSIQIPFNYMAPLHLQFDGVAGKNGADGAKGGTPLLFRDGKDGDIGYDGATGGEGSNLTIYVWQDSVDFYFVRVVEMTSSKSYIYKFKNTGMIFSFSACGGIGGAGGKGGVGGDGKDGVASDDGQKRPGNGGKGGTGGRGGDGGKGGDVYVFIHPNATIIQKNIMVTNLGGSYGNGGEGGKGGKAGTPLTGQTAASDGSAGTSGLSGYSGSSGVTQILVQEFDFQY